MVGRAFAARLQTAARSGEFESVTFVTRPSRLNPNDFQASLLRLPLRSASPRRIESTAKTRSSVEGVGPPAAPGGVLPGPAFSAFAPPHPPSPSAVATKDAITKPTPTAVTSARRVGIAPVTVEDPHGPAQRRDE